MQKDSAHQLSYKYFLRFIKEVAGNNNFIKTFTEEAIRQIVREELDKQFAAFTGKANPVYLPAEITPKFNYLPFQKWKGEHTLYFKLLSLLVAAKYIAKSKKAPNTPFIAKNLHHDDAIVWLQSIPKFIYLVHHLIHTYDSVAVTENLKKSLWENILFVASNSRIPEHANFKSFLTLWSRIEREITHKQRIHHEIDDLLYDVFNEKEV